MLIIVPGNCVADRAHFVAVDPAVVTLAPILSKTRIEKHRREYDRVSAGAAGFEKSCCTYATLACCIGAAGFKDGR
jgi:hypothetical protein